MVKNTMNDTKNDIKSQKSEITQADDDLVNFANSASHDESVDEELLALAPPPPSLQHAIFILIIIGFSFVLMVLFWPELKYFLKGFADPVSLGEAADLESQQLTSDSYVSLEGVPLVNRTVTFSTGTKWFSGDIYRKMAPVSGNPNLLVQWHTSNPDIKQVSDALKPPSSFAGRLKRRTDLSENYNKFWPFYDCLKLHSTSQCKFCIGKANLDECRPIFTCVDNYPIEVCDQTAFFTREEIEEKIGKLKSELQRRPSADLTNELAMNEKALTATGNIAVLADLVSIEEMFDRVAMLEVTDDRKADAFNLKKELFGYLLDALEIRLRTPIEKMASLTAPLKRKLLETQSALDAVRAEIEKLEREKLALGPLVDVSAELAEFVELVREEQEKLRRVDESSERLKDWQLDGTESGAVLLARVRDLSARLAAMKLRPKATVESDKKVSADSDESPVADSGTVQNAQDTDSVGSGVDHSATNDTAASEAVTNDTAANDAVADAVSGDAQLTDPVLAAIDAQLNGAVERVAEVGRKLIILSPGEAPKLDAWAKSTDIVGFLPKPLRADHVFKSFEDLQKMLADVTPTAKTSLKSRYRALVEQQKQKRETEKQLAGTSGLPELRLVARFDALRQTSQKIDSEASLGEAVDRLRQLSGQYAQQEFYPWDLSNYPKVKAELGALIDKAGLPALEARVTAFEKAFAPAMYVLLDDEKPTDNPWILFVYIAVPIMLVVNLKKLLRFIADWRQYGL
ncbi:MAG: hypothetical protein JXX14_17060 [Deltaproteobacteria bacterium]|nr:hypothetical protein [Deltaproteobacteria bacterium]